MSFFPLIMADAKGVLLLLLCVVLLRGEDVGQCSGLRTYLDSYGVVKDHTADSNYSSTATGFNCAWKILPDSAGVDWVTIVFDYFDLANDDYLAIYDGESRNNEKLLVFFTGNNSEPVQSTGRSLYITFASRPSNNGASARGFQFQYSAGSCLNNCNNRGYCFNQTCNCDGGYKGNDCSTRHCANDCGGSRGKCVKEGDGDYCDCVPGYYGGDCSSPYCEGKTVFTTSSGNFSDHFRGAGSEEYAHNTFCTWIIRPTEAHSEIRLKFTRFDTEENSDFVTIYSDESMSQSSMITQLSGTYIPADVVSKSGEMIVTFETDVGLSGAGFSASYVAETVASPTPAPTSPHVIVEEEDGPFLTIVAVMLLLLAIGLVVAGTLYHSYKAAPVDEEEDPVEYQMVAVDDDEDADLATDLAPDLTTDLSEDSNADLADLKTEEEGKKFSDVD